MDILGVGASEVLLVLFVALLVVGPRRLPGLAMKLGQMSRKLKQSTTEITRSITAEVDEETEEILSHKNELLKELDSLTAKPTDTDPKDNKV